MDKKALAELCLLVSKLKMRVGCVVCFVGSNFAPNVAAVVNIIRIAARVPEAKFVIIGDVYLAFKNWKIPSNVAFLGYVEDLDSHLAACDIFLNPKTTSDTGIEVKMFDYLKFGRPIISTPQGARGFEQQKNVIITTIEKIPQTIKKICQAKVNE